MSKLFIQLLLSLALLASTNPLMAAEPARLDIEIVLKQQSGEYHPPYVAAWIENDKSKSVRTLLLWRDDPKWLKDIRRWWRKVGRKDPRLVDAITSATHAAGRFPRRFKALDDQQDPLPAGRYTLLVEVVREQGGRAIIRQPFSLDDKAASYQMKATPETGAITFTITP